MKRIFRSFGELFALWIVIATVLFILAWLVVPQLCETPEYEGQAAGAAARTV